MHVMARHVRVDVYVPPEMDDALESLDESKSEFLREAGREKLQENGSEPQRGSN